MLIVCNDCAYVSRHIKEADDGAYRNSKKQSPWCCVWGDRNERRRGRGVKGKGDKVSMLRGVRHGLGFGFGWTYPAVGRTKRKREKGEVTALACYGSGCGLVGLAVPAQAYAGRWQPPWARKRYYHVCTDPPSTGTISSTCRRPLLNSSHPGDILTALYLLEGPPDLRGS